MAVFGIYSIKGGVGKTASAVNLAHISAAAGRSTLVWDLDPQGAATFYLRVTPRRDASKHGLLGPQDSPLHLVRRTDYERLDVLPSATSFRSLDLRIRKAKRPKRCLAGLLKPLRKVYEHIYLDCASGVSLVAENVFATADVLLMPAKPSTLSLRSIEMMREFVQTRGKSKAQLMPFFCLVDRRKRLHRETCDAMCNGQYSFLNTVVPNASLVERMGVEQAPLMDFAPKSRAARAYRLLWREIQALTVAQAK